MRKIKIYNPMELELDNKIGITIPHLAAKSVLSKHYTPHAWVPGSRYQLLSQDEIDRMLISSKPSPHNSITLLTLSDSHLANIRSFLNIARQIPQSTSKPSSFIHTVKNITDSFKPYVDTVSTYMAGITQHALGYPTVTICGHKKKRVGLHVDSWDAAPIHLRHKSNNRLCINIGRSARRFLFVDSSVVYLAQKLRIKNRKKGDQAVNEIAMNLWRNFPYHPLFAIQLEPGQAYIGPTENIIHDACEMPDSLDNNTLTILGLFKPK